MSDLEHTPYERFKWTVYPAYHWQNWLDKGGRRVFVRRGDLSGFETPAVVEETWRWYQAKGKQTGPVLGPVLAQVDRDNLRTYHPMERKHSALYQDFAKIDYTDRQAILDFATRYGLLGLPVQAQDMMVPGRSTAHIVVGESHLSWAREICAMRRVVDQQHRSRKHPGFDSLMNEHLQHVQLQMELKADTGKRRLNFAPTTLLSALWLQASLGVVGDTNVTQCKHCQRLFERSQGDRYFGDRRGRSDREYCSDSCRKMAYQRRRRTANKLFKAGASLRDIANRTETAMATVRRWRDSAKQKERKA